MNPGREPPALLSCIALAVLALGGVVAVIEQRETRRWVARLASSDPEVRAATIRDAARSGEVHRIEERLVELALADQEPLHVCDEALGALASRGSLRAARLLRARLVELGLVERTDARDVAQLIVDRYRRAQELDEGAALLGSWVPQRLFGPWP
jgi:hypothetical protein